MKVSRFAPVAALIHPFVHAATLGIDDLFIIIIVGVYLCLNHSK